MIRCAKTVRLGASDITKSHIYHRRVALSRLCQTQHVRFLSHDSKDTPGSGGGLTVTNHHASTLLFHHRVPTTLAASHFSTVMTNNDNNNNEGNNNKDAAAASTSTSTTTSTNNSTETKKLPTRTIERRKREYQSTRSILQHASNLPLMQQHQQQQPSTSAAAARPRFGPKSPRYYDPSSARPSAASTAAPTRCTTKWGTSDNVLLRSSSSHLQLPLIKDSSQVPILIPGSAIVDHKPNHPKQPPESTLQQQQQQQQQRRRRRKLPLVNASALLDATTYCRISIAPSNNSNSDQQNQQDQEQQEQPNAAKRLLRGKKDLYDMLRGHIIGMNHHHHHPPRPICLAGHGVPKQLLQDHINLAHEILQRYQEPAECSISNQINLVHDNNNNYGNSNHDHDHHDHDPWSRSGMTIRGHDGSKRFQAWTLPFAPAPVQPVESNQHQHHHPYDYPYSDGFSSWKPPPGVSQEWADRLALYLAVMERLTNKLGSVASTNLNTTTTTNSNSNHPSIHWNITMYRGLAYPKELISRQDDTNDSQDPVPILQWAPRTNTNTQQQLPPRVSIILQGDPNVKETLLEQHKKKWTNKKKKKTGSVTLVYTSSLQELSSPPSSSTTM